MSNYNEVKNLIYNELGITKEWIQNVIEDTVKNEISKLMNNENYLHSIILDTVHKEISRNKEYSTLSSTLFSFNQLIKDSVDKAIYEEVKSKLYIGLVDKNESQ